MRPWTGVPSRIRPGGRPVFRAGEPWVAGKNSSLGTVCLRGLFARMRIACRVDAPTRVPLISRGHSGGAGLRTVSNGWLAVRPRTKPGSVARRVSRQMPAGVAGFFLTQDTAAPERKGHPKEHGWILVSKSLTVPSATPRVGGPIDDFTTKKKNYRRFSGPTPF